MAKRLLFLNHISKESIASLNKVHPQLEVRCTPLIATKEVAFDPNVLDTTKPWAFTSQAAVKAVKKYPFANTVYCVGEKTSNGLSNAITPTKSNAIELAKLIIQNKEKEVIFICGNRKKDDLPKALKQHNIKVKEVVVYETIYLQKSVNLQQIDGLAFMSPSAVHSMNENGGFSNLPCFAIGTTTAKALKSLGQKCVMSQQTNASSMVQAACQYFLE